MEVVLDCDDAEPCELLDDASEGVSEQAPALQVALVADASSGEPSVANRALEDAVERVFDLAAAARALAEKHTSKELQTLAREKGLPIKGAKMAVAERLVQAC